MRKSLHIISLLFLVSFSISCSSDRDETPIQKPELISAKFSDELIGTWKIYDYHYLHDPTLGGDHTLGYYIRLNPDNSVEYKDVNGKTSGNAYVRDNNNFYLIDRGINVSISNSKKFPGQKEFIISYSDEKIYTSGVMTGKKE